jgi:hypothetical protein
VRNQLPDGSVLLAGTWDKTCLDTTEVFDPKTEIWDAGPDMIQGRALFASVTLEDGRVLMLGGYTNETTIVGSAEIYG